MQVKPHLTRVEDAGVVSWTDVGLRHASGVVVAFSERGGGVSEAPYRSLNLAAHVGDVAETVDENRRRLLVSLGLGSMAASLTLAEQVHGATVTSVTREYAGSGASASVGPQPLAAADALVTQLREIPLLLCFADCVPVVLVAPAPAVAVVHAGWRGALAGLPGTAVRRLSDESGCDAADITAYIGPHICAEHYEVSSEIMSQFERTFGTLSRARSGGLDLNAVVRQSLTDAGVPQWRIASLGLCTAVETDRFFSYRAEQGLTGRHGALACILP